MVADDQPATRDVIRKPRSGFTKRRDPLALFEARLRELALLDDAERARAETAVADTVNAAVAAAEAAPWEPVEDLLQFVTSEPP